MAEAVQYCSGSLSKATVVPKLLYPDRLNTQRKTVDDVAPNM